jgi:hypothetical protein
MSLPLTPRLPSAETSCGDTQQPLIGVTHF